MANTGQYSHVIENGDKDIIKKVDNTFFVVVCCEMVCCYLLNCFQRAARTQVNKFPNTPFLPNKAAHRGMLRNDDDDFVVFRAIHVALPLCIAFMLLRLFPPIEIIFFLVQLSFDFNSFIRWLMATTVRVLCVQRTRESSKEIARKWHENQRDSTSTSFSRFRVRIWTFRPEINRKWI